MPSPTSFASIGPSRTIVVNPDTIRRLTGGVFSATYGFITSELNQRIVYEGLVVARRTDTNQFVPYNVTASYGVGSDTAVGILDERLDVTHFDQPCTPIYHGELHSRFMYEFGITMGTISAAVTTELSEIHLKPEV